MARTKKEPIYNCGHKSYDLTGWEGGIAAYWMDGEHGTVIIAVPRIRISVLLLGNPSDHINLIEELCKDKNFYHDREQAGQFASMIMRDASELRAG